MQVTLRALPSPLTLCRFQLRRALARSLSTACMRPSSVNTVARSVVPKYQQEVAQLRKFSQLSPRFAETNAQTLPNDQEAAATSETTDEAVTSSESAEVTQQSTVQEIAATSESTDQVPEESTQENVQSHGFDQEVAAVSETTDQVPEASASESIAAPKARSQRISPGSERTRNRAHQVYVGNLQFEVTKEELTDHFSAYGTVRDVHLPKDFNGRNKGYAFVEMSSVEEAQGSMALDMSQVRNRSIFVQRAREPAPAAAPRGSPAATHEGRRERQAASDSPSTTLFIGNMSYQMTDRDLNDLFREVDGVVDVRVAIDRNTGQPRGFAHADFKDAESAAAARNHFRSKMLYNRLLRCDFSASRRSAGDQ